MHWCITHKSHEWSQGVLCCSACVWCAQAAQEQQLQQPCLSFPTAAAWPRCKVLKPKSLSVQQCRAQGREFLTWSQEWRRIWKCVFSLEFSPLCKGLERWFEEELLQELRNGGILRSFLNLFKTLASVCWPVEQIKKNKVRECSDSLDTEAFCKTD